MSALLGALGLIVAVTAGYVLLARAGAFRLSLAELRQRYVTSGSRFVTLKGVEIHYKDEGTGPALLLINGSYGNLRTWDGVTSALKGKYRLIRVDIAPQGLSGSISDAVAKSGVEFPDILNALLDKLGIANAAVVGVSSGGTEAFRFASKYPERVNALVLSQTPSFPVAAPTQPLVATTIFISDTILEYRPQLAWNVFLDPLWFDQSQPSNALIKQYYDFNRRVVEKNARALIPYSNKTPVIKAQLGNVTAPTLLVWGDFDPVLPLPTMVKLRDQLVKATTRTVVLKNVGHYPPLEAPDRFAKVLDAYLQGLAPARSAAGDATIRR